ncbi:MAG: putative membrane protein, partial [Planctomycetota bacterium]
MSTETVILEEAEFDTRLPKYYMLQILLTLAVCIITIPLIPVWLVLGWGIHKRQYEALACELTSRSLNIRRGIIFKVQKSIPLDKITDLAVNEGPLLRYLGLCSLQIETAGGGQGSAMGQAALSGVVDALGFRDKVLAQRDRVTQGALDSSAGVAASAQATSFVPETDASAG